MEVLKYAFLFLLPGILYFLVVKKNKIVLWNLKDFKNKLICFFLKDKIKKYKEKYRKIVSSLGDNLESEINILTDKDSECQYFYGVDQNENSLMLKIELGQNAVASIILHLRIRKNKYVLEGKRGCFEVNLPKSRWKINGLNIEVLEPFKRLRITYNGLLRNTSQRDSIEHVQFNFIFVVASSPQFVPQDIPDNFLSKYLQTKDPDDTNSVLYADQYGLSQFGVLKGTVKIQSSQEFILNLPASRSRFKGTDDKFSSRKVIKIVAIDEYGNFFEIVLKWFEDGISKLKYGFAYLSTEKRYPITKIDITDPYVISEDFKINISVKVNEKIYKIAINLDKDSSLKSLNVNKVGYEVYSVQGHCKINNFVGRAIVELWNDYQGSTEFIPELKLCEKHEENLPEIFICDLKTEESQILDLTGGKGCSLALLTSLNSSLFNVPEGFIVTVKAYLAYIQENPSLTKSILILNDICCGKLDEKLEEACERTVTSFKNQKMSQNLKDQIITQINKYTKEDFVGWAVRSSGIVEDSEEFSAAGQNETFLGCQSEDKIMKSVLACWASLYTYQSVLYRWQHGLPVITDIAVVVQKMVRAESAGVLFTCHPSTCNPGQMVVTSNFGLGETVVSGESDPDTFILKRTYDNEITVVSKTLGSKNKVLKMTENGVQESTSEAMNSNLSSLTDSQAIEIGKVGVYLENVFGNPRDIEWGFYKDKLYLFQSRPITTLNHWTDFELSHEFDAPFLTSKNISTTANIREVVPRAVTVLTRSSSLRAMDWALQKHVQRNFDPATLRGLITYQHNLFLNVLTSIYLHASEEVLPSDVTVDLAIFGHPVIDKNINEIAKNIHGISSGFEKFKEILRSLPIAWKNRKHLEMSRKLVENMNLEGSTDEELYEKIDSAIGDVEKASIIHSMTSRSSVFYQICTMNVLLEKNKEILTEHMSDFALILSSCEDVISAEVPKYLEGISKIIKEKGHIDVFQNIDPSQGFEWLKNHCKEAFELYLEFIEKHGHRSFAEFEIIEPTWNDSPEKVISMIQANVGTERKEKIHLEVEDIIEKLQSPQSNITRTIVKFLTKKIRVAVGIREQTKSYLVKAIDYVRKAYRELGDQMVARGLLPSKDLIFHLTHYEIGLILQNRNPSLITKAVRRQKLYNTWNKLKFSEINYGVPEPEDDSDIHMVNPKEVCKGTPVCRGVVQARACVIRTLDEIHTLKSGDILITYSTDIGWSPYFPMLSGVVTELGGLVSHGAVVAREYGLPCVVGVRNVLKYFKTGDIVQLNGDTGELGKLIL